MNHVVALLYLGGRFDITANGGPNKDVDLMLAPLINQCGNRSIGNVIKSPTNQGKALRGKVSHWRREIQLPIKPGFHRVRIFRGNINQVTACHQRTNMTTNNLTCNQIVTRRSREQITAEDDQKKSGRKQRD